MIVRRGPDRIRDVTDHGPGAANVAGIYAINTIALVEGSPVADVERRWVDPILPEPDPPKMAVDYAIRPKVGKFRAPRPLRDDTPLWDALRKTRGNVTYAAELLGRDRATLRKNLQVRVLRGTVPPDVAWLLAHPKRRPTTPTGTRHHSPETRALISLRMREYKASKRAAA